MLPKIILCSITFYFTKVPENIFHRTSIWGRLYGSSVPMMYYSIIKIYRKKHSEVNRSELGLSFTFMAFLWFSYFKKKSGT